VTECLSFTFLCQAQINAGIAQDEANLDNIVSNVITFWYDTVLPVPTISSSMSAAYYTNTLPIPVTVHPRIPLTHPSKGVHFVI
jgi:hypothetical protein